MDQNYEMAEVILTAVLAKIPCVDSRDLSILADILQQCEQLKDLVLPQAFIKQVTRTVSLCSKILMKEVPFEAGVKKLEQSCEKMLCGLKRLIPSGDAGCENGQQSDTTANDSTNSELESEFTDFAESLGIENDAVKQDEPENMVDLKELRTKFVSNQAQVLDEFESLCLDFEKNKGSNKQELGRILHTWKGEFSVLGLGEYAKLMHSMEDILQHDVIASETFFRLKDLLSFKFLELKEGKVNKFTQQQLMHVFEPQKNSMKLQKKEQPTKTHCISNTLVQSQVIKPTIPQHFDASLLSDFVAESREHFEAIEPLMLSLENDSQNIDTINTIFRSCHTIKGVAGFLGFVDIGNLAHSTESLMDLARKKELLLNPVHIDLLFQAIDCLKLMIQGVDDMVKGKEFVLPAQFEHLHEQLSNPHLLTSSLPNASLPKDEKKIGQILVEQGVISETDIKKACDAQLLGDERKLGEILVETAEVKPQSIVKALAQQYVQKQNTGTVFVEETVRVPVERLDQLIDSIGEAVIAQSMVYAELNEKNTLERSLERKISQANLIMRQIQELSMSLRMVSVKSTFQKMARLVRDLSKKTNKLIDFISEGEDTELDKTVVEKIGDPLMHMMRNCVDHGIETAQERSHTGKPSRGYIKIKAYHKAGSVVIEVEDDGRGLDSEKIVKKAIEKGLYDGQSSLTEQEIFQFIFLPGFSTAATVTDVSGRGVGMDVVRRNIEFLRGSIEIQSQLHKGTCFIIKLPLTLAIIDGMIVRAGKERYIVPTLSIVESLKPSEGQIHYLLDEAKTIQVRGSTHPLVELAKLLNHTQDAVSSHLNTQVIIMIVEDMIGKRIGLQVDDILGQQQVVIKTLGTHFTDLPGIAGGAIMSDGGVNLILDIGGIIKMAT